MSDTRPCKHGNTSYCEDCVTAAWTLSGADGYERGLVFAVSFLRGQAGASFGDGRDDEARLIRNLCKRLEAQLDEAKANARQIRIDQGILKP